MPGTIVFSHRGVHVMPARGDNFVALYVPSNDQVTALKDFTPNSDEIAQRLGANGRAPLWREERGQAIVYGYLPPQLANLRQALKVWRAADFVPAGHSAFFFIFGTCVIHGIREIDDERRETWRTTVLTYPAEELNGNIATAAADLLLRYQPRDICVALDGPLATYEELKKALQPLGVVPVPYATLKPATGAKSLFAQRNYSALMALSIFLAAAALAAALAYLVVSKVTLARMGQELQDIRHQIQQVQINQSLGYIREPQPLLDQMRKSFDQQPSAILDVAARLGAAFGSLDSVGFSLGEGGEAPVTVNDGLLPLKVTIDEAADKLLVEQEAKAKRLLPHTPWVRDIASVATNHGIQLLMTLQISAPEGSDIPSATAPFEPSATRIASPTVAEPRP
jgi:hypothetical protein